jgi:hypothetical protein
MSAKQISIGELLEYWKYAETLKPGDIIERYIEPHRMPPWNEICSGLNWQLRTVDGGYFGSKEFGYAGVYRLFGLAAGDQACDDQSSYRPIGTSTLYIGESGWLNQLRRSLNHSEDTHGAIRMWRKTPILSARFPSSKLGVGILFTSVKMHGWVEQDLIRAYMNSFGDSPPLNCSF